MNKNIKALRLIEESSSFIKLNLQPLPPFPLRGGWGGEGGTIWFNLVLASPTSLFHLLQILDSSVGLTAI